MAGYRSDTVFCFKSISSASFSGGHIGTAGTAFTAEMAAVFAGGCSRHLHRRGNRLWHRPDTGQKVLYNIAAKEDVEHGEELMDRYGLLAVFIGGITPIPDFLLAYLAGFTSMRLLPFLLCDGFARLLRSLLVTLSLRYLGTVMNVDAFGTWFSLAIMLWLVWKWWKSRKRFRRRQHPENKEGSDRLPSAPDATGQRECDHSRAPWLLHNSPR